MNGSISIIIVDVVGGVGYAGLGPPTLYTYSSAVPPLKTQKVLRTTQPGMVIAMLKFTVLLLVIVML